VAVGLVHRPHGLRGEVSVEPLGTFPDPFEVGSALVWRSGDRRRDLRLSGKRRHGKRVLLSFDGVPDVESAKGLAGGVLCLSARKLPVDPEFFWSEEIRGWRCENRSGERLGVAALVEETPGGPQLTVQAADGREVLVPFVRPIIVAVDRGGKRIVLDPPEGLMDL
jgi:16S rRNA processing protein RimM